MNAVPSRAKSVPTDAATDLGPIIREQKATHAIGAIYVGGGAVLLAVGVFCLLMPLVERRAELTIGGICTGLGLAFVIAGGYRIWTWRGGVLYLHERGIRRHRAGQESIVRFDDVQEMKYQSTRLFVHGTYGGTVEHLSVRTGDPDGQWLSFQHRRQEKTGLATGYLEFSDVGRVSHSITNLILPRMARRLAAGDTVSWTSRMRLNRNGVELSRTRWYEREFGDLFRRQPCWEFFAWQYIDRAHFNQGVFFVWVKGQETPRLRVLIGDVNFHPGYALFAAALAQFEASAAIRAPAAPLELKGANRAENLTLKIAWNTADHISRQWHWDRSTAAGRRDWRVRIWVPSGIVAILGLLLAVAARLYGRVSTSAFLLLLAGISIGACLCAGLLHMGLRWSERRRIAKEINVAHELAQRGAAADPLAEFELVLGPPGYSCRLPGGGETQVRWQQIARVEYATGYIFLHTAASTLARESIDMMIPPRAFANESDANSALERIKDWHARAIGRGE